MDSRKIAFALEEQYPEPSLHLDSPVLPKVEACVAKAVMPLRAVILPPVPRNLLNTASVEYFERTREARFGMPLRQFETEHGGDKAWEEATPALKEAGELLRANGGPFFLGETGEWAFSFNLRHSFVPIDGKRGHDGG